MSDPRLSTTRRLSSDRRGGGRKVDLRPANAPDAEATYVAQVPLPQPVWVPITRAPKAGDVVHVGAAASVQFLTPITVRVIGVIPWSTYEGYLWLDVYVLDWAGDAIARRKIWVRTAGLSRLSLRIPG
jgi:hypothetical protein